MCTAGWGRLGGVGWVGSAGGAKKGNLWLDKVFDVGMTGTAADTCRVKTATRW